jgi:hypothetical protein
VYVGLESTNDAALREMRKGVNRDRDVVHSRAAGTDTEEARRRLLRRYRAAVGAWHDIGTSVECGYILGFDADGAGMGAQAARDLLAIGADVATFFLLTALPGSEDFARAVRNGTLRGRDFNAYFTHKPTLSHPTVGPEQMEHELQTAVRAMWTWPAVLRRVGGALLGIGRARTITPWTYAKRQLGYKAMLMTGLFTYVEGGLFRRANARGVFREAVSDEEARRHYLGEAAPLAVRVPPQDDSTMISLPVLERAGGALPAAPLN